MLVIRDLIGPYFTIKSTVNDENHVRIGLTVITLWVDGKIRRKKELSKPPVELTLNELSDLLIELKSLE